MNLYDFLNIKDDFIKINSNELNIVTLVKAFNAVELTGEQVGEIIMHPSRFLELQKKAKNDIFEGKNIYQKIIKENEIFGAQIILDNKIDSSIIQLNSTNRIPNKSVKLFIEN